jgi:hypothetical protein
MSFFDNPIEHPKSTVATDDKPPDEQTTKEDELNSTEYDEETATNIDVYQEMSDDFDDKPDAKTDAMKHASKSPHEAFPFDPGITVVTTKPDEPDEEEASSEILSFEENPKNFSPRPPVSEFPSRMFYFRAADQLLFSSSQPAQLQNYVVCWGGRPLQLMFSIYIYICYRPQKCPEVDVWERVLRLPRST